MQFINISTECLMRVSVTLKITINMDIQYLVVFVSFGLSLNIALGMPSYEVPQFEEYADITSDEIVRATFFFLYFTIQ